ncbi:MAG TPA: hypothetical protein VMZ92_12995 [Planctomycetota bacterium]|nr:hypothetical protein [Planctomycetota bacterium]
MSTLGKIFAFVVLVCAVAFASAAYVLTQEAKNWKALHDKLKAEKEAEIAQLNQQIVTLQGDLAKAKADAERWRTEVDNHKVTIGLRDTEIARLNGELKELQNSEKRLKDDVAEIKNQLNVLRDENKRLADEKEAARVAKETAEKAQRKAEDERARCEDDLRNLRKQLELTKGDLRSALDLNNRYEDVFGEKGKNLTADPRLTPLPKINGMVKRADNNAGIIMISVGQGDGVDSGMSFEVTRGGGYVGRIRVTNVYDEEAICRVVLPMTPNPIREGDYVTTRVK